LTGQRLKTDHAAARDEAGQDAWSDAALGADGCRCPVFWLPSSVGNSGEQDRKRVTDTEGLPYRLAQGKHVDGPVVEQEQEDDNMRIASGALIRVVGVALMVLGLFSGAHPDLASALEVGQKAPNFSLASTTGEKVSLGQFLGKKAVLVEFYGADFAPV
jgi:hypothetical protein